MKQLSSSLIARDWARISIGAGLIAVWLLVLTGVPDLTQLPPAPRRFFAGGVTLMVEAENAPCRVAGASIGAHVPGSVGMDLLFPKLGRHKRGLVASAGATPEATATVGSTGGGAVAA